MTREEWKNNKDFDEISRDMGGLFSEWPTPADIVAGAAESKAEQVAKDKPKPAKPSPVPPWGHLPQ